MCNVWYDIPMETSLTFKQAWEIVGGLGTPSKMPGYSWSISARKCVTGGKLRKVANSICEKCYAFRGNYNFSVVTNAQERRLNAALNDPRWVDAMVVAIAGSNESNYMRFFDAGDIQNAKMFSDICEIARRLPKIKFWLPTKEYGIVSDYVKGGGTIPNNLTVRLSAYMVDGQPPIAVAASCGVQTSGVTTDETKVNCPSSYQGNKCLECRNCWDRNVANVNYLKH